MYLIVFYSRTPLVLNILGEQRTPLMTAAHNRHPQLVALIAAHGGAVSAEGTARLDVCVVPPSPHPTPRPPLGRSRRKRITD